MLKILGKDLTNGLLYESACLMGRSILQEVKSVVELRHTVNKYYIFFIRGKLKRLVMKYILLGNWNNLVFPAMLSLTELCSFSPVLCLKCSHRITESFWL